MRLYQRVLLVAGLTGGMIAAGAAWERFYVSPLVEQAQRKPDSPESGPDDLPAECLAELDGMGQTATASGPQAARPAVAGKTVPAEPSPAGGNVLRSGNSNRTAMQIQVSDDSPAPATMDRDATARPIQQAQSADWLEPAAQPAADPRAGRRLPARALPISAQESLRRNDAHGALPSADVLDLMRRVCGEDGEQRAEARRELLRRGFNEVDLNLAPQLFSPDVEARKQLARTVPRLSSVDAAKWLMWLAKDPQPDVRLIAVSLLATTGDPALLDTVEALAREDLDPQVHALADQIAKQRDLTAKRGD